MATIPMAIHMADARIQFSEGAQRYLAMSPDSEAAITLASQRAARLSHARELLGSSYKHSVVGKAEAISEVEEFVRKRTAQALPGKWKSSAPKLAEAILDEARKHRFDPIFLMAVIQRESSFRPEARGTSGEIGLMQLMPDTGRWIASKIQMKWSDSRTLQDPVSNVILGAQYLSMLREQYDSHGRLYLAAYNMGSGKLKRSLDRNIWPREYPMHVMKNYLSFYSDLQKIQPAKKKQLAGLTSLLAAAGPVAKDSLQSLLVRFREIASVSGEY